MNALERLAGRLPLVEAAAVAGAAATLVGVAVAADALVAAAQALSAVTVNAAHVLGRADRKGRLAPGYDADILLLDAPDWRYLAYHLGGPVVSETLVAGVPSRLR